MQEEEAEMEDEETKKVIVVLKLFWHFPIGNYLNYIAFLTTVKGIVLHLGNGKNYLPFSTGAPVALVGAQVKTAMKNYAQT